MSHAQLREEYRLISQELQLGTNNTRTYKALMHDAELMKAQLMGATTWIDQCRAMRIAPPRPQDRPERTPMGATTGAAHEDGIVRRWTRERIGWNGEDQDQA